MRVYVYMAANVCAMHGHMRVVAYICAYACLGVYTCIYACMSVYACTCPYMRVYACVRASEFGANSL